MYKKTALADKLTLEQFRAFRFQPIVPQGDLKDINGNPLAENLPYWRKHKLVPFVLAGSWNVKISFSQVIWLRMLDHLKQLSYTLNDTKLVCDYIFKAAYFNDLSYKNLLQNQAVLQKMKLAGTLNEEEVLKLAEIDRILNNPLLLYGLKLEINYLTDLVAWCIENAEEAGLLVFAKGKVAERRGDKISSHLEEPINFYEPHIYLSIRFFLEEFLNNDNLESIITPFLLNENEKKVLRELHNKNVSKLEITLRDGKLIRIDSQEIKTVTGEKAREIRRVLGLRNYEEVTLNTRDESILHFKKIRKKILPD